MNLISKLLKPESILLDLDVGSKKRVFEQVGILFENYRQIARAQVYDSLFAREKLGSTGLGHGIAIPHGRLKHGRETLTAFVRTKESIPFDAPDGNPVRLIFVVLVPEHATETHLQILSELAQMFSEKDIRDALLSSADAMAVYRLLTEWPSYAPAHRRAAI
ncbi:MAG: PTS IIA-like nitrogen regulatory protein PtsN [Burkholderiales bacterium]|nr:PTS IIA-like nitrogen regulatory protein PtsN [Burkholderiales bacterium]